MRSCGLLLAAVALFVAGAAPPRDAEPKRYRVEVCLLQGDPLGSPEQGTIDVLSQPILTTLEKQECSLFCGQSASVGGEAVEFGYSLRATLEASGKGKVRMRVTAEIGTLIESSDDRVALRVDRTVFVREAKLGQTVRVRLGKRSDESETWVELTPREAK